ncbi:NFATC4 isoform 14, partial [Pan troglodytes]
MGAASCEDEELEFKLVFGEEKEAPPLGAGGLGEELDSEDAPPCCRLALGEPPPYGAAPIGIPRPPPPRPGMHSPPPRPAPSPGTWESQPARTSALPPLDWPLPSQYEQLELRIEVQPRAHHRAHYETEGSRGAVKAAPG